MPSDLCRRLFFLDFSRQGGACFSLDLPGLQPQPGHRDKTCGHLAAAKQDRMELVGSLAPRGNLNCESGNSPLPLALPYDLLSLFLPLLGQRWL